MKKIFSFLFILLCLCAIQPAAAQGKQKISVLYVGGSAELETKGVKKMDSLTLAKSAKVRMNSFEKFLKARFKTVKVIDAKQYTATMSDKYDVTIFDGTPTPIRPEICEYDKNGRITKYARPAYLPDNFSHPTLCIANASEDLGRSVGSKCDWYCLCLDADAHSWKKDHPIFQGPWKVNIKSEMKPTPATAIEYGKPYGEVPPAETEMWTVQTKSYIVDRNYRIGMVSRPNGFLDSPEAEIISGGVSAKTIDAVAIGRHGNFLHWGFSASPTYLTEAGKAALANAIVYIAKVGNEHIIARKLNEKIPTRKQVKMMQYLASREAWQDRTKSELIHYQLIDSIQNAVRAKIANGETPDETQKMYLSFPNPKPVAPTYATYLKQQNPTLYHFFGDDAEEYKRYYEKNIGWFYPDEKGYNLDIDEDVRTLGIANNDVRLLERCISMLEKGEETALATRVLHRYTLCRFATLAEWRNWFDTYKDKMFFTESGGWLFLINTQDRSVPGNDYSVLQMQKGEAKAETSQAKEEASQTQKEETDPQNPVWLAADIKQAADGNKEVVVRMKIHPGYHTYALVAEEDPFIQTEIKIELPNGYKTVGKLQLPATHRLSEGETTVFEGDNLFRQVISGKGSGIIKCIVTYQCCNQDICLPPVEKELSIKLQ